jgi:hypothetical protein
MVSSPMASSVKYLQIFIYNTPGVTREGMFPMLSFPDRAAELNFVRALVSRQYRRLTEEPYFVINNPQLLPDDVRRLHMHVSVDYNEDTGQEVIRRHDNCFSIRDNLELLLLQNIDNNSVENAGFSEVLRTFIR